MTFTVSSIYFVQKAHLTPLQLVLTGTMLEISIFLFEIPTGVVADVYSRRLSVIIGTFLVGAGLLLEGSLPFFWAILLAQLLWGVGYTFTSGAQQAWISDEIGEEAAGQAFLRGAQMDQLGSLGGIVVGTLIGLLAINLPMVLAGGAFLLFGGFLVFSMPETGFHPTPREDRTSLQHMLATFQNGLAMMRRRPALLAVLGIGFVYGLYSEGFDRLWVASMLQRFQFPIWQPVIWFGIIRAAAMLLTALATGWMQRRVDTTRTVQLARIMLFTSVALIASLAVFAWSHNLALTIAIFLLISVLRQVNYPIHTAWVNHRLDPQVRATVLSMSSQMDALGQIAGGPVLGIVAQQISIQAGLFGSAALLSPVLALLGIQLKQGEEQK